jgi:type IV fimbrial biogenesis protein FimT
MVTAHLFRRQARSACGFTLIELMIVVVLLAILSALAGPSLSGVIGTQRVRTTASNLHLALMKARSEALKRNAAVTIAPVTGTDWNSGWDVRFAATVLDVYQASPGVLITPSATVASVNYAYSGRTTAASQISFVVSSTSTTTKRCVSIDSTGRPYNKEGSTC